MKKRGNAIPVLHFVKIRAFPQSNTRLKSERKDVRSGRGASPITIFQNRRTCGKIPVCILSHTRRESHSASLSSAYAGK